jgi:Peptidase propeptide and YPEB domain
MVLAAASFCGSTLTLAASATDEALSAQAKVSETDARRTALAKVPGGAVQSSELEREHGRLIWSFDIGSPRSSQITEVNVDAVTGKILATHAESPAYQKKEAESERRQRVKEPGHNSSN